MYGARRTIISRNSLHDSPYGAYNGTHGPIHRHGYSDQANGFSEGFNDRATPGSCGHGHFAGNRYTNGGHHGGNRRLTLSELSLSDNEAKRFGHERGDNGFDAGQYGQHHLSGYGFSDTNARDIYAHPGRRDAVDYGRRSENEHAYYRGRRDAVDFGRAGGYRERRGTIDFGRSDHEDQEDFNGGRRGAVDFGHPGQDCHYYPRQGMRCGAAQRYGRSHDRRFLGEDDDEGVDFDDYGGTDPDYNYDGDAQRYDRFRGRETGRGHGRQF